MGARTRDRLNLGVFLRTITDGVQCVACPQDRALFSQGTPADAMFYIENGRVKITVRSRGRREAILGILGKGDFLGHGWLVGQVHHISTATTMTPCALIRIENDTMAQLLDDYPGFSRSFFSYLLARNARLEEDLLDQLFHTSEQRLARALLLLASFDMHPSPEVVIPKISQQTLADLVGTTRSRVNFFMNRFREKGFIDYNDGLHIYRSLVSVTLQD